MPAVQQEDEDQEMQAHLCFGKHSSKMSSGRRAPHGPVSLSDPMVLSSGVLKEKKNPISKPIEEGQLSVPTLLPVPDLD